MSEHISPSTPNNTIGVGPRPLGPSRVFSVVELRVSCKNLLDRDTFSKSDPVCILYQKDFRANTYSEVGRTEQIKNSLNPEWNTKFTMDFRFEERQVRLVIGETT